MIFVYLQLSVSMFTKINVSNMKNNIEYKDVITRLCKDTLKMKKIILSDYYNGSTNLKL